ncbi:unnamed protein product [Pieris macdunnoughi]|uniref:Uncharacterized protein n=1 Tax=Pieris macdunnoughi TaxID=345717 RepID=A0A821YEC0_9NEOP|nr:unnamed protein product [Pieris macdunnoughi]
MEDAFKKLQSVGQNSVDNLIKWMKDSKIIDGVIITEERARKLFADVADVANVELSKFQAAISKLATEQLKNVDVFMKSLADEGPKFLEEAVSSAGSSSSAGSASSARSASSALTSSSCEA